MLTFHTATWDDYFAECQPLWREHYEEIALRKEHRQMKPDTAAYRQLAVMGALDIMVVRDQGQLVGYMLTAVRRHMHYADVLCAYESGYFLRASSRRGMAGVRMIRAWAERMRLRGVKEAYINTKPFLDMSPIFERLGAVLSDKVYCFTFWDD